MRTDQWSPRSILLAWCLHAYGIIRFSRSAADLRGPDVLGVVIMMSDGCLGLLCCWLMYSMSNSCACCWAMH